MRAFLVEDSEDMEDADEGGFFDLDPGLPVGGEASREDA